MMYDIVADVAHMVNSRRPDIHRCRQIMLCSINCKCDGSPDRPWPLSTEMKQNESQILEHSFLTDLVFIPESTPGSVLRTTTTTVAND